MTLNAWTGLQDPEAPKNIREGEPYNDPKFEELARTYWVWGTAQAALCAEFWKAARRAPVGAVPQGWKLVPVEPTEEMIDMGRSQSSFPTGVYRSMLAAAPHPPDTFQTAGGFMPEKRTTKTGAAPMQMPEPAARTTSHDGEFYWDNHLASHGSRFGAKLYTEQQVRALLAQHNIT